MVQVQPRQACLEVSTAGDDEIDTRISHAGFVVVRIDKRGCAVLRHPLHLIRQATPLRTAIAKRAGWGTGSDFTMRLRKLGNYLGSIHYAMFEYLENLTSPGRQGDRAECREIKDRPEAVSVIAVLLNVSCKV